MPLPGLISNGGTGMATEAGNNSNSGWGEIAPPKSCEDVSLQIMEK